MKISNSIITFIRDSVNTALTACSKLGASVVQAFAKLNCIGTKPSKPLQGRANYEQPAKDSEDYQLPESISEKAIADIKALEKFTWQSETQNLPNISKSLKDKLEVFAKNHPKLSPQECVSKFLGSYLPAIQIKCYEGKFDKGQLENYKVKRVLRKILKKYPRLNFYRPLNSSPEQLAVINTAEKLLNEYEKKEIFYAERNKVMNPGERNRVMNPQVSRSFEKAAEILQKISE
jgi:hypothetical protein